MCKNKICSMNKHIYLNSILQLDQNLWVNGNPPWLKMVREIFHQRIVFIPVISLKIVILMFTHTGLHGVNSFLKKKKSAFIGRSQSVLTREKNPGFGPDTRSTGSKWGNGKSLHPRLFVVKINEWVKWKQDDLTSLEKTHT